MGGKEVWVGLSGPLRVSISCILTPVGLGEESLILAQILTKLVLGWNGRESKRFLSWACLLVPPCSKLEGSLLLPGGLVSREELRVDSEVWWKKESWDPPGILGWRLEE